MAKNYHIEVKPSIEGGANALIVNDVESTIEHGGVLHFYGSENESKAAVNIESLVFYCEIETERKSHEVPVTSMWTSK